MHCSYQGLGRRSRWHGSPSTHTLINAFINYVYPYALKRLGEVARLTCTPDYAYGAKGFPAWGIMPNSPLIFEIEVLSIE